MKFVSTWLAFLNIEADMEKKERSDTIKNYAYITCIYTMNKLIQCDGFN
jgi:hypothetical protein